MAFIVSMTFDLDSINPQSPALGVCALTQMERLARYRELAADARRLAKASPREAQHCYLLASEWWRELATDLENHMARENTAGVVADLDAYNSAI
jgi:hypothetical protein